MNATDPLDAVPPSEPPAEEPPPLEAGRARFTGAERPFWRLLIRGAMLLFVSLGIYRFWLATDIRRFLWSNTEISGDGLEYTGTARELLLGFLIAIALLIPINALFFVGAFAKGIIGQLSGAVAFVVLALLGQFAVYRARRYRLTRTVYRGIRFHQTGSAWRYAVCALFWWAMMVVTLGLAYPFAQASLERFKLAHTFYGDLRGRFEGSGFALLFRGLLMWIVVIVPFLFGIVTAVGVIDWNAVGEAMRRGSDEAMARMEAAGVFSALVFTVLSLCWSVVAAAILYPVFQAMTLRWWMSGLRFGQLTVRSRLRTGSVYGLYMRFVCYALLFAVAVVLLALIGLALIGGLEAWRGKGTLTEVLTVVIPIGTYVIVALSYSTIYQAAVKLRLWKLGCESLELAGVEALDHVKAAPATGSAVGEGLADALHVGGI